MGGRKEEGPSVSDGASLQVLSWLRLVLPCSLSNYVKAIIVLQPFNMKQQYIPLTVSLSLCSPVVDLEAEESGFGESNVPSLDQGR